MQRRARSTSWILAVLSVMPDPRRFVVTNAELPAEALFAPEAWCRGDDPDNAPVGLDMLCDESLRNPPPDQPVVGVRRFLVDAV